MILPVHQEEGTPLISEQDLQGYRNHIHQSDIDQSGRFAMGKLLDWIVQLDERVDELEQQAQTPKQ